MGPGIETAAPKLEMGDPQGGKPRATWTQLPKIKVS